MYEGYWRLDCKPFENTPDPKFLYYSPKHEEALMRLLYVAKERKQGAVLTGEYGSGKTVLSQVLLQDLMQDTNFQVVSIVNPKISKVEFIREILFQLGEKNYSAALGEMELLRLLEETLKNGLRQRKKTIFVFDEAQILSEEELEGIRLMLNFSNREEFFATLIFIGQSDLKRKIQQIEPLKQRLALRFHLEALDMAEVEQYLLHRLKVAGRNENLFSPGAVALIYEGSQGIPRRINNICDYALLVGFSRKASTIGVEIIGDCLRDLDLLTTKEEVEKEKKQSPVSNGEDKNYGTFG